eukprot:gene14989-10724_t
MSPTKLPAYRQLLADRPSLASAHPPPPHMTPYNYPAYGAYRYGGVLPVEPTCITTGTCVAASREWKQHYTTEPDLSKASRYAALSEYLESRLQKK